MATFGTPAYAGIPNGTTLTIPAPPGLAPGDVVLVAARCQSAGGTDFTLPEGFTRLGSPPATPSAQFRVNGLYWRLATASEPAAYEFTSPDANARSVALAVRYTPSGTGEVAVTSETPYGNSSWPETSDFSSLLTLYLAGCEATAGNSTRPATVPAGVTEVGYAQHSLDDSTAGSRTAVWLGYREETSPSRPAESFTWAAAAAPAALRIGTTDAAPGEPVTAGSGWHVRAEGTGTVPGDVAVRTAEGFDPVTATRVVASGYGTAAQMLATPGFTIAHRGGSKDWPEMTRYAYGQSALHGYNALEVSVSRSSDGVFLGLHDRNLQRTSGVDLYPPEATWQQIQEHMVFASITNDPGQSDQPYMRLEEVVDLYPDHVLLVDSKHLNREDCADLLDYLDSTPRAKERIVAKSFFKTATLPADEWGWDYWAGQRGYIRWGYAYTENIDSGELADWQHRYEILGLEYAATQTVWDSVLSYGKPVIGHICSSQAAVDSALGKGASGAMVSSPLSVTP